MAVTIQDRGVGVAGKRKVIIADDSQDIRGDLAEMLSVGYDVVAVVEDGKQLVAAAMAMQPDLLVIDVSMPVLNGLEALRRLRSLGVAAIAVMVSTNAGPAYVRRAFEVGASGYVLKGSGVEDLQPALEAVLRGEPFVSPGIHWGPDSGHLS